jgi:voltage-gated potassium channel Kch
MEEVELTELGSKSTLIPVRRCKNCPDEDRVWQYRIHRFVDHPSTNWASRAYQIVTVLMILLSTIMIILSTHGDFSDQKDVFLALDDFCAVFFTLDIAMRLGGYRQRVMYFRSWLNIVDVIAVFPFYISLFANTGDLSTQILRYIRLSRVLSLLKLVRHLGILEVLKDTISGSLQGLALLLLLVIISATIFATCMFLIEQGSLDSKTGKMIREDGSESPYESIPVTIYWAITTFTTVGYGDITPISIEGRILANLAMVFGVIFFALPLAIISNSFNEAWGKHRKKRGKDISFFRDSAEHDFAGHFTQNGDSSELREQISKFKRKHEESLVEFEKLLDDLAEHKDHSFELHNRFGQECKKSLESQIETFISTVEQKLLDSS